MEQRKRLIEILNEARKKKSRANSDIERQMIIVDELLANGVIVPPCKVGGKIYYIDKYSNKVEEDIVKFFTVTQNGVKPILTWHNTKFWDIYEWGKTVFLTKEEAEEALKEREENA